MAMLLFSYPPPPSPFLNLFMAISTVAFPLVAVSEVMGIHLQYSKLWNVNPRTKHFRTVPGRTGMGVMYFPALVTCITSFVVSDGGGGGLRYFLLRLSLTVHFLKRVLEVLFIHKFSARVAVHSMILVSFSYFMISACTIYSLHLSETNFPEPPIDLTYPGLVLFLVGICGNFYHHLLLSGLRGEGEKSYKIPKGGMFDSVLCPHYLFEIIDFIGIAFISQTPYSYAVAVDTVFYLAGRSYTTRRWYKSKFEDFPEGLKALVPYIF